LYTVVSMGMSPLTLARTTLAWLLVRSIYQVCSISFSHGMLTLLSVGEYAIILSTFASGQYGAATLEVSSSVQFTLDRLQAEGAGMHLRTVKGVWCVRRTFE
jgi:hypothetical protein